MVFQGIYDLLYFHKQWMGYLLTPYSHLHLVFSEILMLAILLDLKLHLVGILFCTSLITNNVEHFLLAYWPFRYHFCKVPGQIFCVYFQGPLHILATSHLSDVYYKYFFRNSGFPNCFNNCAFDDQKFWNFIKSKLSVFKIISAFCVLRYHSLPEGQKDVHHFFKKLQI